MKNRTLQGYNLNLPSKDSAIASLSKLMATDKAKALWQQLCNECAVGPEQPSLSELERLFKHLSKKSGRLGGCGMSLSLRIKAYQNISRLQNKAA